MTPSTPCPTSCPRCHRASGDEHSLRSRGRAAGRSHADRPASRRGGDLSCRPRVRAGRRLENHVTAAPATPPGPRLVDELRMSARYAAGLRAFLRAPFASAQARLSLRRQLERRADTFLRILQAGIYGNARSPYRRMLEHAGAEFGDVARLVQADGVEAALAALYGAGVRITIDEFKGRRPIDRPGLSIAARPADFDNPLLARHYESRSGGSRGVGTRVIMDLDLVTHEAAYYDAFMGMFGLRVRPVAVWRDVPPPSAGLRANLRYARLGQPPQRLFTQQHPRSADLKFRL